MNIKKEKNMCLSMLICAIILLLTSNISFVYFVYGDFIYKNILIPAELSVILDCNPEYQNLTFINTDYGNYQVSGTFCRNQTINVWDNADKVTLMHENCHLSQYKTSRLATDCRHLTWVYLNELECYIAENLNDKVYKFFYGDFQKDL